MEMKTVVRNRTNKTVVPVAIPSNRSFEKIEPGRHSGIYLDPNATYREYCLFEVGSSSKTNAFSVEDCREWRSIEVGPRKDDPTKFEWKGMKLRKTKIDAILLSPGAWKDASGSIEALASFSVELEKDEKRVVIYRAQCANLVKFCSQRVQKIREIFSLLTEIQISRLYRSRKLPQLTNSLDSLLRALLSAQKLLKGCGQKEWRRAALVLSLPPPDPEKYSGSKFAHVIRELGWRFDMVQYALDWDGTREFKWDDGRDRYVFQGNQLENGVATDEMELLQGDKDRETSKDRFITHEMEFFQGDIDRETFDRQALLTDLESGSISEKNFFMSLAGWFWYNSSHRDFAVIIKKRCHQADFDIDYPDLKGKKYINGGGSKAVYKVKWLGLEVAIAGVWNARSEDLKTEARVMVTVRHPNVVDFFGYAFRNEENGATEDDPLKKFLMMEVMEEDLGHLIEGIMEDPARRSDFGGPFSLSVTVDILMQIVKAMIHSHKHKIMHRDLKSNNCLVSKKPGSRPDVSAYYTVKVTDFGSSKSWDSVKKHTERQGTVRYMALEAWERDDYTYSVDVYSFGMVCYEVVTGFPPFNSYTLHKDLIALLKREERPPIPGTCPESLSILMKKCWAATPDARPTFETIWRDLWRLRLIIEAPLSKEAL